MDHENSDNDEQYVFSSPASWRRPKGIALSAPSEILRLTRQGRVEFVLDSGRLIFSAPASLTKRKYEGAWGWMRFVVGPRLYTLYFHNTAFSESTYSPTASLAEAASKRRLFKEWRQKLDQAAALPADNESVVASVAPPALDAAQRQVLRMREILTILILLGAFGIPMFIFYT